MHAAIKFGLLVSLIGSGCANTPKEKMIQNILLSSAVGFAIGQNVETNRISNGIAYAGVAGTVTALWLTHNSDLDQESENLKAENKRLRNEMDKLLSPTLEQQTTGMMSAKIPSKYAGMINPGEWKIYALDQWVELDENRLVHQDKIMELIPPSLKPATLPKKGN